MNKRIKILMSVIISIFIIIGFDCLYGFTIGGKANWVFYIASAIFGLALIVLLMRFINGKEYFYTKEYIEPFVLLLIIAVIACWWSYNELNKLSSQTNYIEYDTVVEYSGNYGKSITNEIGFKDQNGSIHSTRIFQPVEFDDDYSVDDERIITVREYKGGFGFNYYDIIKVDGNLLIDENNSKE